MKENPYLNRGLLAIKMALMTLITLIMRRLNAVDFNPFSPGPR